MKSYLETHSDGQLWLVVPIAELIEHKVIARISNQSYVSPSRFFLYLETHKDMYTYIDTLIRKGLYPDLDSFMAEIKTTYNDSCMPVNQLVPLNPKQFPLFGETSLNIEEFRFVEKISNDFKYKYHWTNYSRNTSLEDMPVLNSSEIKRDKKLLEWARTLIGHYPKIDTSRAKQAQSSPIFYL